MSLGEITLWSKAKRWNPFTLTLIIIGILGYSLYLFSKHTIYATSTWLILFNLLFKITIASLALLILLAIASLFFSYLYLRYALKKGKINIEFSQDGKNSAFINIESIFLPLLGHLELRLHLEPNNYTEAYPLKLESKEYPLRKIKATISAPFEEFKEYKIKGGIFYFIDMLNILRLPIYFSKNYTYTHIPQIVPETLTPLRASARESVIRVPKIRKTEGDWVEFKKFDQGDDVRRIIWKLYAKNKELMTRKVEEYSPYTSTLHVYIDFSFAHITHGSTYQEYLLQKYKTQVQNILASLNEIYTEVIYYFPQQRSGGQRVGTYLLQQEWDETYRILHPKKYNLVITHSLAHQDLLQKIYSHTAQSTDCIFVDLLPYIKRPVLLGTLRKIFLLPERHERFKSNLLLYNFTRLAKQNHERIRKSISSSRMSLLKNV